MLEKITTGSFETNTYLLYKDSKCIIIDPGLDFYNIAQKIKEKYQVEAILLTHGHLDHIDGIRYFDVPVYLHQLEEDFLYDETLSLYKMINKKSPYLKGKLNLNLVKDGDEFELLGYQFKAIHTPGHTRGSVCYLCGDKLFSGDTLFLESVGRTDFPTGDMKKLRQSLKKLFEEVDDVTNVYPGHEEKTSIKHEKKYNPYRN